MASAREGGQWSGRLGWEWRRRRTEEEMVAVVAARRWRHGCWCVSFVECCEEEERGKSYCCCWCFIQNIESKGERLLGLFGCGKKQEGDGLFGGLSWRLGRKGI